MSSPLPAVFDHFGPIGFQQTVTLTRIVAGTFDPVTGGTTPPTTTNFSITALVESFPVTEKSGTEVDVESVQRGDLRIHVKAADLPFTPDTAWTATVNGTVLRVLEVDVVNGEIYVLRVRR